MEINRDSINRLLSLNDRQLKGIIQNLARSEEHTSELQSR